MGQEAGKINIENKERRKKDSGAHTEGRYWKYYYYEEKSSKRAES